MKSFAGASDRLKVVVGALITTEAHTHGHSDDDGSRNECMHLSGNAEVVLETKVLMTWPPGSFVSTVGMGVRVKSSLSFGIR